MKKTISVLLCLLLILFVMGCNGGERTPAPINEDSAMSLDPVAEGNKYEKYLTAAEVEKVTGITGLRAEEEGVTLRFLGNNEENIYEVRFYGEDFYEKEVTPNREYYTDVSGVGDKAAICIPDAPYRLTFVKGKHSLMTQTLAKSSELKVKEEHLIELAKILADKL